MTSAAPRVPAGAPRRRLLLLLHGARIYDPLLHEAIHELKDQGDVEVTVRVTWDSGDVDRFVREAALLDGANRFDTIVAGGGDGTLNELVAALLRPPGIDLLAGGRITVAQLPLGTANDLASASGISLDPREALALAVNPSAARPIDVALVNGEVFLNLATVGPVSEVSSKGISDTLKKALGPAAILLSSLKHVFAEGFQPKQGVAITYPLVPTAQPPPPPPKPATYEAIPQTKVLADTGLAYPDWTAVSGGGSLVTAAAAAPAGPRVDRAEDAGVGGNTAAERAPTAGRQEVPSRPEIEPIEESQEGRREQGANAISGSTGEGAAAPESVGGAISEAAPKDGLGRLRGALLALVAGQSRQMGRMINVCPDALLDDGMLDFTVLFGTPRQQVAALAADVMTKGIEAGRGGIVMMRVPWLLVESRGERLKTNRDGEPTLESTRLLFEVRPRAIKLHLPDSRLLVSGLPQPKQEAATHLVTPQRPKRHRRRLLRDLLRAQQPPGWLRLRLAGLRRMAGRVGWSALMFVLGFAVGVYVASVRGT